MTTAVSLGTWISTGSALITELAAEIGFDWVLLDLEHGATTQSDVLSQLQSLARSRTQGIVRVGNLHPEQIGQLLDWGAHGIMLPHVASAEKAEDLVRAAYHPPKGNRGLAKTVRATRFGIGSHTDNPPPLLVAQIESAEAVENAESIAAVPGIDVLFVGPADLQHHLQNREKSATAKSESYADCLKTVCAASAAHGKAAGILLKDHIEISRYRALGFTFIAVESDFGILRSAYQQILSSKTSVKEPLI
jgi:2-dehydro-3-deoxyglucarate aldolase/4-hydroxy-2-oxoheptanedioate aldolase